MPVRFAHVRLAMLLTVVAAAAIACGRNTGSPAAPSTPDPATARYQVTFSATWSSGTHPMDFPSNPHFSGLVGATHRTPDVLWSNGVLATDGIRAMAERGSKSPLTTEVDAAIASRLAEFLLSGGGIDRSPGSVSLDFDITQDYPLVTLVSMVAPSPDWFVGVNALRLFENGAWLDDVRIDLLPYDAGTDSGVTFLSPDVETLPRQAVARQNGAPFLNGSSVPPLGTFRFRLIR